MFGWTKGGRRGPIAVSRYAFAAALPVAAAVVRVLLSPWLQESVPFITFFPAVMVSAWLGGLGPGLLSTFVSAVITDYLWLRPLHGFVPAETGDALALALFTAIGVAISALNESLRRRTAGEQIARTGAERLRVEAEASRQAALDSERQLRKQVETVSRLHALTVRLATTPDMRPALLAVLEAAVDAAGAQFGLLSLHDRQQGFLHVWASLGFDDAALKQLVNLVPGPDAGACGKSFATKARVVVADTETDPLFERFRSVARGVGFRAVHSTPIINRDGHVLGVLSVHFADIHAPAENEIALADICARHAADIIETATSQQALREADKRKDEFIATLAHELRNPLAPILSAVRLQALTSDRDKAEKSRTVIERQVLHLARLVDDLLDVSRIATGKMELRREILDVRDAIHAAVETSRPAIESGGHTLSLLLPEGPLSIDGDGTRLAQVFGNLLNNAAKYMDVPGTIELMVDVEQAHVVARVTDHGIGIPRERLDDVFDLFSQVDRSVERARGGLGIGLTLVKRLVEMHGGTVDALSEGPGLGSTFVVRLPVATEQHVRSNASLAFADRPSIVSRVLVVDDNRDAAETLRDLLVALGSEAEVAFDGETAIARAQEFQPAAILLDIGMPIMNGYEVARRIRATPALSNVVLVALTGWGQASDRQRTAEAGFDAHLVKPPMINDLVEVLASDARASLQSQAAGRLIRHDADSPEVVM